MSARPFPQPTRRISPRWLLAGAMLVVIGFAAICGSVLGSMRAGDERLAQQTLGNLAGGIDADINRTIELYDLSLRAVAANMVVPAVLSATPEIRQLILFDHSNLARHCGAIQVIDDAGTVTIDSTILPPKPSTTSIAPASSQRGEIRLVGSGRGRADIKRWSHPSDGLAMRKHLPSRCSRPTDT